MTRARCEIVLALPRFHDLHQEDDSVIDRLIRVLQNEFLHNPLARGWDVQAAQTETSDLAKGLGYALQMAHKNQHEDHAFVLITTPEVSDLRAARQAFMQWPHNAGAIVVVADDKPVSDKTMAWFKEAAALAREDRVTAMTGSDILADTAYPRYVLRCLAGHRA